MQRAEIEGILRQVAMDELGTAPDGVVEKLERLDSLERMQLAVAVEDRFAICLDPADEAELDCLEALARVVERKLGLRAGEE